MIENSQYAALDAVSMMSDLYVTHNPKYLEPMAYDWSATVL